MPSAINDYIWSLPGLHVTLENRETLRASLEIEPGADALPETHIVIPHYGADQLIHDLFRSMEKLANYRHPVLQLSKQLMQFTALLQDALKVLWVALQIGLELTRTTR